MAGRQQDQTRIEIAHMGAVAEATTAVAKAEAARQAASDCDVICTLAAATTLAAQRAAGLCIAARDDAAVAKLIAEKAATNWCDVASRREARLAAREAASNHKAARATAEAASLAARKAAVHYAAQSRHAVAAASAARKAATMCDAVSGHRAAEAASAAREAATGWVGAGDDAAAADGEAATNHDVPHADAAAAVALAARKAAASCDMACGDAGTNDAKKLLQDMRGWLMTVAALFVDMSYEASISPPSSIQDGTVTYSIFMLANMFCFANALIVIIMLVSMREIPTTSTLRAIRAMMFFVAVSVVASFAVSSSMEPLFVVFFIAALLATPILRMS